MSGDIDRVWRYRSGVGKVSNEYPVFFTVLYCLNISDTSRIRI